jgi:two-component system, OmpR family, alkaline phosphatase synthesis response regulator PhoP
MNKKKILVVDDDVVVIKALSIKLQAHGFEVVTAMDGAEAVNAARTQRPDLILLDITFPANMGVAWDGLLIMEWLKRLEETANTPIILITGGDREKYERRAKAAGAVAFFHKPISHDELIVLIRQTLELESVSA